MPVNQQNAPAASKKKYLMKYRLIGLVCILHDWQKALQFSHFPQKSFLIDILTEVGLLYLYFQISNIGKPDKIQNFDYSSFRYTLQRPSIESTRIPNKCAHIKLGFKAKTRAISKVINHILRISNF